LLRVGGSLLLLVVLGVFGVGRLGFLSDLFAGDLHEPNTLGGEPRVTGPLAAQGEAAAKAAMHSTSSHKPIVALYGGHGRTYILLAQRGRANLDREFADAGVIADHLPAKNRCGTGRDGETICMRTSNSLSVMVAGNSPVAEVSAALDEAWDAV
jgi:hypothetical protein